MIKIQIMISMIVTLSVAFHDQNKKNIIQLSNSVGLLTADDINKGASITQAILDQSKAIFQQAYVFNGDSITTNAQYIRTKMNELYQGNYVVIIFNDNSTSPIVNTNVQMSIQSINNSWWFYWKGPNHYKPTFAYFISRNVKASGSALNAYGNDSATYINTTSRNVINAVQQDSTDISYNVEHVKSYLSALNTTRKVNIIITKNVSYYLSVEGITGSQHLSLTPILKNNDLIWYTV